MLPYHFLHNGYKAVKVYTQPIDLCLFVCLVYMLYQFHHY